MLNYLKDLFNNNNNNNNNKFNTYLIHPGVYVALLTLFWC